MDSAQGDMAKVDEVGLMLQGHQKQLETVHELGRNVEENLIYYLKSQLSHFHSASPARRDVHCVFQASSVLFKGQSAVRE